MGLAHVEGFLAEAVQDEPEGESGLSLDELYGLYTSWCLMYRVRLEEPEALWKALKTRGIDPAHNHLSMRGPAAADYILASAPNII